MSAYYISRQEYGRKRHYTGGTYANYKCPLCNSPIGLIFLYDTTDSSLNFPGWPNSELPFLYCLCCDMWHLQYEVTNDGIITVKCDGIPDVIVDINPSDLEQNPLNIGLIPNDIISELNDDTYISEESHFRFWYSDTFGPESLGPFPHLGEPLYILAGGYSSSECPKCNKAMSFIGSFYNTCGMTFEYSGNMVQFVFSGCLNCKIIDACIHV